MKSAELNILSYCNQDCIFCYGVTRTPYVASYNFIAKLLNRLRDKGVEQVVFTGGEVTLRPDIIKILRYAKKLGFRTSIITNGERFIDIEFCKEIFNFLDSIEFAFHGHTEKLYNRITHTKSFSKALAGVNNIKILSERFRNLALTFNVIVNIHNYRYLLNIVKFIQNYHLNKYVIHFISVYCKGAAEKKADLLVDFSDSKKYLKKSFRYGKKNNILLITSLFPICVLDGYEQLSVESIRAIKSDTYYLLKKSKEKPDYSFHKNAFKSETAYIDKCGNCSLISICPGIENTYLESNKSLSAIKPSSKNLSSIINKISSLSPLCANRMQEKSIVPL